MKLLINNEVRHDYSPDTQAWWLKTSSKSQIELAADANGLSSIEVCSRLEKFGPKERVLPVV
jgi:hypothetical protein